MTKVHVDDVQAKNLISTEIQKAISELAGGKEVVYVCIGTDRSTGDALGPLVGTALKQNGVANVYGTLDEPVHAVNLHEVLAELTQRHTNPFIVAIDACLGQISSVGTISHGKGPIKPGAGVNKELGEVGDYFITGVVNVGGFMEYFVLQNTRLSLVTKIANIIAGAILTAGQNKDEVVSANRKWVKEWQSFVKSMFRFGKTVSFSRCHQKRNTSTSIS